MRKFIAMLMASVLFLGTSEAQDSVKFASAAAIRVCGDPIGVIVSNDKGDLEFLTVEQLAASVELLEALKAVPAEKRGTLNVGSKAMCLTKS